MCSVVNRFTVATFCQFLKCTLKISKDKGLFHEAMATVLKCIQSRILQNNFFLFSFSYSWLLLRCQLLVQFNSSFFLSSAFKNQSTEGTESWGLESLNL